MHLATAPEPSKLPTRNMRTKINGLTANTSETLSKEFSPPSYSQPQVDWGKRLPPSTKDYLKVIYFHR